MFFLIGKQVQHSYISSTDSTVQYSTVQYSTAQYSTVHYSTVQYSTVQCSAVQCSAVQYITVQYNSTVQSITVQSITVMVELCHAFRYGRHNKIHNFVKNRTHESALVKLRGHPLLTPPELIKTHMYLRMYVWSLHIARTRINRVRFPILLVASWTGKMNISLSPFAPENLVSRDGFGSPVPRQSTHLHTQAESGFYSRGSFGFPRRLPFIHLNHHTPSGQSRVFLVTQLRTHGVHCRESAGTGPVNFKVVPNERCLGRSAWTN